MDMVQALRLAMNDPTLWARPKEWRGLGVGFEYKQKTSGWWFRRSGSEEAAPMQLPTPKLLMADWECFRDALRRIDKH